MIVGVVLSTARFFLRWEQKRVIEPWKSHYVDERLIKRFKDVYKPFPFSPWWLPSNFYEFSGIVLTRISLKTFESYRLSASLTFQQMKCFLIHPKAASRPEKKMRKRIQKFYDHYKHPHIASRRFLTAQLETRFNATTLTIIARALKKRGQKQLRKSDPRNKNLISPFPSEMKRRRKKIEDS